MRLRRPEFLRRHPHTETLVVVALLAALAGGAVVTFGLYNVSARVPHLPPVHWALHTTYLQAVRLRAEPASAVPDDLMDPARIGLGARHFDAACRRCHAAPGELRPATVRAMRPEPPHVTQAVGRWEPRHLHWILREGVKMSGMPAWPAERDDEPWSTVSFLESARDMDAEGYARLTARPDGSVHAYCAGCHGVDGVGELGPICPPPRHPGRDLYRHGARQLPRRRAVVGLHAARRDGGVGGRSGRDGAPLRSPARGAAEGPAPDPALVAAGERLVRSGTPDDPSCIACHGPDAPSRPEYPALAGQHEGYLAEQLRLWRGNERGGGPRSHLMSAAAADLDDEEIAALAAYYASLEPRAK